MVAACMNESGFKMQTLALGIFQNMLIWIIRAINWSSSFVNLSISVSLSFFGIGIFGLFFVGIFWMIELMLFIWVMIDSYLMIEIAKPDNDSD